MATVAFESMARHNTMAGTHGGAKPLTSWPRSKEEEESVRISYTSSRAYPNHLKTSL
jgi:hypothetical protein